MQEGIRVFLPINFRSTSTTVLGVSLLWKAD